MTAVPVDRDPHGELSRLVAAVRGQHDPVTLTEDGETVAVVLSPEEFASLAETVDILSTPGEVDAIDEGIDELDRGLDVDGPSALAPYLNRG